MTQSHLLPHIFYMEEGLSHFHTQMKGLLKITHPKSHSELNEEAKTKFKILQSFWTRWRREYVTALREYQRASGKTETKVKVGDIVQIHDETKRIYWKLGIVQNLITGRDGHVRAVNLQTSNGITNRPITKLYPLELHVDNIGDI